jgi:N-acetyl-alpha-D-muramate 1-phosphate uridylyltransferase
MILAAGLGTRLRPLTDHIPKALVEVAGVPMLERVARRLVAAGATRLIVNVHHHADLIEAFVRERGGFGVEVAISREPGEAPLETGGGLLHARRHFQSAEPFVLHNVDVISDMDLAGLYAAQRAHRALATLAVSDRETTRPLLFDDRGLYGWADHRPGREAERTVREPVGRRREWGFAGVHVIDPSIFDLLTETGAFSIIPPYLRLSEQGHPIRPHDVSGALWLEIGTPERLEEARAMLAGSGGVGDGIEHSSTGEGRHG